MEVDMAKYFVVSVILVALFSSVGCQDTGIQSKSNAIKTDTLQEKLPVTTATPQQTNAAKDQGGKISALLPSSDSASQKSSGNAQSIVPAPVNNPADSAAVKATDVNVKPTDTKKATEVNAVAPATNKVDDSKVSAKENVPLAPIPAEGKKAEKISTMDSTNPVAPLVTPKVDDKPKANTVPPTVAAVEKPKANQGPMGEKITDDLDVGDDNRPPIDNLKNQGPGGEVDDEDVLDPPKEVPAVKPKPADDSSVKSNPKETVGMRPKIIRGDDEPENSHFLAYLLTIGVLCILAYVIAHNRHKIMGLVLEGRQGRRLSRSGSTGGGRGVKYKRLQREDADGENGVSLSSRDGGRVIY